MSASLVWANLVAYSVQVLVLGVDTKGPGKVLSRGQMSFRTSSDPVGAPLFSGCECW